MPFAFEEATKDKSQNIIKVIGVGGGGSNAVINMYKQGVHNVLFAICNTDSQALAQADIPIKIQLGSAGLGVGGKPEKGREAAESSIDAIQTLFEDDTEMVFITCGMGGGTGTGAAPVIAGLAKEKGILTVGVVTIPFAFEGKVKIKKALQGVEEMRKRSPISYIDNIAKANVKIFHGKFDPVVPVTQSIELYDAIMKKYPKSRVFLDIFDEIRILS